jgi:hypothetical protein
MHRAGTTARGFFILRLRTYIVYHIRNVLGAFQQPFTTRCPVEIGQPTECVVLVLHLAGFCFVSDRISFITFGRFRRHPATTLAHDKHGGPLSNAATKQPLIESRRTLA